MEASPFDSHRLGRCLGAAASTAVQSDDKFHVPLLLLSPDVTQPPMFPQDSYPLKGTLFKFVVNVRAGKNLLPVIKSIFPLSVQFSD